jgi:hypothetical protein
LLVDFGKAGRDAFDAGIGVCRKGMAQTGWLLRCCLYLRLFERNR